MATRSGQRLLLVLAAAVLVRVVVAFVLLDSMPLVRDANSYSLSAMEILDHPPGRNAYFWPPGMPALLAGAYAVLGKTVTVARLVTVAIGATNVVLVHRLARRLFDDDRIALAAAGIAALYPPALLISSQPYSQELSMLCVTAAAVAVLWAMEGGRLRAYATAGAALGFGILSRPSTISVVVALGAFALARRRFAGVAVASAVILLVVAPVVVHNRAHEAGVAISTNNERNFLLGNNSYAPLYKTGHLAQREPEELEPEAREYVARLENKPRSEMVKEGLRYVARHPAESAIRVINRTRAFWGFDYVLSREIQHHFAWTTLQALPLLSFEAGGYLLAAILALVGLIRRGNRARPNGLGLIAVMVFSWMVPYLVAHSYGFYHHPVMGLLLPFAVLGVMELRRHGKQLFLDRRLVVAILLLLLIQVEYGYFAFRLA